MRVRSAVSVLVLLPLLSLGCLRPPRQDYAVDQIQQIGDLKEIMRVQAQAMDPLFKKRTQTSFTAEEFAQAAAAARKLQATSATVRDKFAAGRQASFASYAADLNRGAGELQAAAESSDVGRVTTVLNATRDVCRGCHRENR